MGLQFADRMVTVRTHPPGPDRPRTPALRSATPCHSPASFGSPTPRPTATLPRGPLGPTATITNSPDLVDHLGCFRGASARLLPSATPSSVHSASQPPSAVRRCAVSETPLCRFMQMSGFQAPGLQGSPGPVAGPRPTQSGWIAAGHRPCHRPPADPWLYPTAARLDPGLRG